jgi:hypothetical protein
MPLEHGCAVMQSFLLITPLLLEDVLQRLVAPI